MSDLRARVKKTIILHVDDNPTTRYTIGRTLGREGFKVMEAATGGEALRLAKEGPDLVILDVKLPDIGGFEVCRRIKADPTTATLPVLHLSATYVTDEAQATGLDSGADGYLVQPVDPRVLVASVKALLRLRRAEEELNRIVTLSPDLLCVAGLNGYFKRVNPAFEDTLGYTSRELLAKPFIEFVHPEDRETSSKEVARLSMDIPVGYFENRFLHKDGSYVWLAWKAVPVVEEGLIYAAARDVTESKHVEAAMAKVREAERRRIARDLHDGVLQDLAAVVQGLEAARIEQKVQSDGREGDIEHHQEVGALRHAASTLRRVVYDLRSQSAPSFLTAVESLVEVNLQRDPDCKVRLEVQDDFPQEVPNDTGRELLAIVQEALTNARCHSEAYNICVSLKAEGAGSLVAEVVDDGRGFDPASANGGMGIVGMRERASLLGGDMMVSSEPGKGTSIRVRVPKP
jgi:PAS domain S-box-containing protein